MLLQLIEQGNAKDSNISLNFEEERKVVEEIAKKYQSIKGKLSITPRFTYPIVEKYCKEILGLDFPKTIHGCGAGTNFSYINNRGELYPCDRYKEEIIQKNSKSEISLVNNEFYTIWGLNGFDDIYKITEGNSFYNNLYPCNQCENLRNTCYPCPLTVDINGKEKVELICSKYLKIIDENKNKVI